MERHSALVGRRVSLDPIAPSDGDELVELCARTGDVFGWPLWGYLHDGRGFVDSLDDDRSATFVLRARGRDEIIGMIRVDQIDHRHGTASVEVLLGEDHWSSGWALEGVVLVLESIFEQRSMWKVYFEVTDAVLDRISSAVGLWIEVEARLREHLYASGRHRDVVVLALDRCRWFERVRPAARVLLTDQSGGPP